MSQTLELAEQLISRPSVTPEDAGCLELIAARLSRLGFACERIDSGPEALGEGWNWSERKGPCLTGRKGDHAVWKHHW